MDKKKWKDPRPGKGAKVILTGTIMEIRRGEYARVRIDDFICGFNNCDLTVHRAAIRAERKRP